MTAIEQILTDAIVRKLKDQGLTVHPWAITSTICDAMKEQQAHFILPRSGGIYAGAMERERQKEVEGYSESNDAQHYTGELAEAGACYADLAAAQARNDIDTIQQYSAPPETWPWGAANWKPSEDPQRNLEKAIALLAAEWDRHERMKPTPA